MTLKNLISVSDMKLSMMLTGIRPDGSEIGYDFANKVWLDNNLYTPERIIVIKKFRNMALYSSLMRSELANFSICSIRNMKALKDIEVKNGDVVIIKIKIGNVKTYKPIPKSNPKLDSGINKILSELEEDFIQTQVRGIPLK